MDRVFAAVNPLNGTALVAVAEPTAPAQLQFKRKPALQHPLALAATALVAAAGSPVPVEQQRCCDAGLLWRGWMQARDELQHQRQLQLIERLKPASEPARSGADAALAR